MGLRVDAAAQEGAKPTEKPADKPKVKPIRALLITGGCCHDYEKQKKILTEGISSRALVEWEIVHQGGSATNAKIPFYENPDWAKGFDIVVHNECFADIPDPEWTQRVLKPHKAGTPAIVIHCAMHCYRDKTEEWFKFLGVTSHGHGANYPFEVVNAEPKHPAMQGFGNVWMTPKGELYQIVKVWDTAKPLAYAMSVAKKNEPVIWTNQYGNTRVFGTTIGHHNEEIADPVFLNFITNGLLWAVDKHENPDYHKPLATVKKILVPVNLALKKPASAPRSQEGHDPAHGNDGSDETRWCSPDAGAPYTWQVDLERPEELTGGKINWEQEGAHYKYKLEGSVDGKTWTMLSDQSEGKNEAQEQELKFAANGVRYVRLTFLGARTGSWGSFFELEVHGKTMVEKSITNLMSTKPKPVSGTGILREIKVPDGFTATVFAAPPNVSYPTCLATTYNGVVYVGVDENGSLDRKPKRGRIVRCVDSNDDGQADKFTTFAEMDSPRGIVVDGNAVYVQHPPFISVYNDDNADGVSDRSEVLVKGLGFDLNFRGADHTTNGMTLGIDGWLYVAVGDYGFVKAEGTDGKTVQLRGGGVVRVRPDGKELEIVSRGQRNIYDVAVDPYLNLFTRDNTNDGGGWNVRLSHVIPQGQYGYPSLFVNFPDEIVQPLADYGGGSPCGSLFIDDANLPDDFGHSLYTCDWGRSIVYRHPLTGKGAGFDAEQQPFVEIPRPTDMDIDGRSQIFISSWKDGGFNYSGPNVGYVIRVAPREGASPALADLVQAKDQSLLAMIGNGNHVQRLAAQRELLRRGSKPEVEAGLLAILQSDSSLAARVAALFTIRQLSDFVGNGGKTGVSQLSPSLYENPRMREFVLRALADRRSSNASVPADLFVAALKDPNARVRLQAVIGLTRLGRIESAEAMVPLTVDSDPLVAHATIRGLVELKAGEACLRGLQSPTSVPGCLQVLQEIHDPLVLNGLVAQYATSKDLAVRQGILKALCRLCLREADWTGDWWSTRPDTSGPYYNVAPWSETDKIRGFLQQQLSSSDFQIVKLLLGELKRHKLEFEQTLPILVKLGSTDEGFRPTAVDLLSGRSDLTAEAGKILADAAISSKNPNPLRAKAARALHRNFDRPGVRESAIHVFSNLISQDNLPGELQAVSDEFLRDGRQADHISSVLALLNSVEPAEAKLGYAILLSLSENPQAKREARDVANKTLDATWFKGGPAVLTLLHAVGTTKAESQALQVRLRITSSDPRIEGAAKQVAKLLELDQPVDPNQPVISSLKYEDIVARLKTATGDLKQGQRLFARQGCVACHTVSPNETLKGPLLAGISARYKRDELIESILKPSQKLAQGFESQFFVTHEGKTFDGFVVREAGDEIEVRLANSESLVIKKSEIDERGKRVLSMMPEKLVDSLTINQLAALLAYLESLKAK
ncbi:MAG: heme-binding protein [Planctomycetaceae bacterium]|nr:heme-binding protein [Planctomycetaceae bacterium]